MVAAALAEVEKIKKDGVTAEDLAKIKETYLVAHKEAVKTNSFWVSNLINLGIEERADDYLLGYENRVNALTANQIQKAAQKFLDDQYFLAILMPE